MNKLVRYGMLAAYVGAGAGLVASPVVLAETDKQMSDEIKQLQAQVRALQAKQQQEVAAPVAVAAPTAPSSDGVPVTAKGATINLGGLRLTPGGFFAGEVIYRRNNENADISSNFSSYYYRSNPNYYSSELRPSARQSRVQLLAQGPEDSVNKVEGFIAADFLSSGTSSNSKESNSYTLRIREAYSTYARKDYDFYILAGQTWSLATMYKTGLNPRSENIPIGIDPQYVVGFQWARQAGFRYVQNLFHDKIALGIAVEEPQDVIAGTAPAGATGLTTGMNVLNNTTTYSDDIAPDVIYKIAVDPGFGHYELYGMTRFFHDRAENTPSVLSSTQNHNSIAQSFGGGLILPVIPKMLDFQLSGLVGHGIGRYGSGQLADSTYSLNDGSIAPIFSEQGMLGLVAHPTKRLDLYTYAGVEHNGSVSGYGAGTGSNATCNVNPVTFGAGVTASCTGVSTVRELTGGFWYKFYQGSIGYMTAGAQVEFVNNTTYADKTGIEGKTNDTSVLASFRYYPYQK